MVVFSMDEADMRAALSWRWSAVGSDQLGVTSRSARVHPRAKDPPGARLHRLTDPAEKSFLQPVQGARSRVSRGAEAWLEQSQAV